MTSVDPGTRWSNQDIVLFHGTDAMSAQSLLTEGISLAHSRAKLDFGIGFYTTTNQTQAQNWALARARYAGNSPAVASFTVDREALSKLDLLWFVRGDAEAEDFWSLVAHCRGEGQQHLRPGYYDVVVGPVAVSRNRPRRIMADSDQVSFHTSRAILVLTNSPFELVHL